MDILYIAIGLIGLMAGGEYLVRGAVAIAQKYNISPMVIGLTLVGFGTSTPELVTSIQAALNDAPGIAVGNVVGSNIANILLILGIAALVTPIAVSATSFKRDGAVLVFVTVLLVGIVLFGVIGRLAGLGLIALLVAYLVGTLYLARGALDPLGATLTPQPHIGLAVLMMGVGLIVTILGARFLVQGAISIASDLGVSEAIIGLTVVAVGTSLPELVTSVIAARKGQVEVALGNIIGSNIFNILGILGVTALVKPLNVPVEIANLDIWVMGAATILLCGFSVSGWRISRTEGAFFLSAYIGYVSYLVLNAVK